MADDPDPLFRPEQRDDGRWIYTVRLSSGERQPFGSCADGGGHGSAEAARACARGFLLAERLTFGEGLEVHRCEICQAPTRRYSTFGVLLAEVHHLCDAHATRETVAKIMGPLP